MSQHPLDIHPFVFWAQTPNGPMQEEGARELGGYIPCSKRRSTSLTIRTNIRNLSKNFTHFTFILKENAVKGTSPKC